MIGYTYFDPRGLSPAIVHQYLVALFEVFRLGSDGSPTLMIRRYDSPIIELYSHPHEDPQSTLLEAGKTPLHPSDECWVSDSPLVLVRCL